MERERAGDSTGSPMHGAVPLSVTWFALISVLEIKDSHQSSCFNTINRRITRVAVSKSTFVV